jgi:NADH-quinone oxidoreductase subunit L
MPEQTILLLLIALLPLLGALAGFVLRRLPPLVHALLGSLLLAGSAACAIVINAGFDAERIRASWSMPWITPPAVQGWSMPAIPLALQADYTQILFILTTCLIGIAVQLYAIRERRADPQAGYFHALLSLFCGAMLLFLVSDTLLLLYFAWELMGLAGYLLIRYRGTPEAFRAARQAFWTTRATDFGLLFAIFIFMFGFERYGVYWVRLSQVNISALVSEINGKLSSAVQQNLIQQSDVAAIMKPELSFVVLWLGIAALLILLAVIGKAALLPLSFWLPDAMVAPAPVSALLHSATLVAAGPLLVSNVFFGPMMLPIDAYGELHINVAALYLATLLGGLTMLIGAICAACQTQPKKLLAWSTVSQLGLCVLGSGALASEAARFLLLSHAWYKAALFLAVGIIVAVWHEQHAAHTQADNTEPKFADLRSVGASRPLLYWLALLPAGLSLAGVAGLAGFFGKEQIIAALLGRNATVLGETRIGEIMPGLSPVWQAAMWMAFISVPFTAAYCGRLLAGMRAQSTVTAEHGVIQDPETSSGWNLATGVTILLALIGSIGLGVFWFSYRTYCEGLPIFLGWAANFDPLTTGLTSGLIAVGGFLGVRSMAPGGLLAATPLLSGLAGFFREGLYLKQIFTGLIGGFGEFLAILAGIADIRLIDWLATRAGRGGRFLAAVAAWLDQHLIDGLRWWCCEIWWIIKRLHGRYMQNGQIQNYMFIMLLGAVLLCIVVLFPLSDVLGRMLGRIR